MKIFGLIILILTANSVLGYWFGRLMLYVEDLTYRYEETESYGWERRFHYKYDAMTNKVKLFFFLLWPVLSIKEKHNLPGKFKPDWDNHIPSITFWGPFPTIFCNLLAISIYLPKPKRSFQYFS